MGAERALQESHRLLHAIVEGTSDAMWLKDLTGRHLMNNSTGARWLGKTPAEIIGKWDDEIVPPELAQTLVRERPSLRVLFMSGYTDEAALRHGHLASGEAFLHKPFSPTTLARRVRALLDEKR